jgi:hypothetical protein
MVTDAFNLLLQDLGKLLKIKLESDAHNSCLIRFPNKFTIQLELDRSGNFLLLGSDLAIVPPGRYRENVFREALKANGLPSPRNGDFAYSKQTDRLILSEKLLMTDLNGDKLLSTFTPFLEKARYWHDTIAHGDVPAALQVASTAKGSGMFGLK